MSSPIALQELFKAGFEDFVIPSYETAPYTTIQNRAQVTRSLKAIAGVERVITSILGFKIIDNEFGPNGEPVHGFEGESRIRVVGSLWYKGSDGAGTWVYSSSSTGNEFVEITFYGTGLNFLTGAVTGRDVRVSVDGGTESANIMPASISNVFHLRNYRVGVVISVTSGLALGWHTVKLRNVSGLHLEGFEIINERTDLAVFSGAGISNGSFTGLSSLATSAFNQGVVGTRGARVVKYVENGTLKSAVQEVDATAKYLTNTDHTNEEVVRRINFREFGANRADDFSTLDGVVSTRAFTLDDGTTTLVGTGVNVQGNGVAITTPAGNFLTLTFVGTGLDVNVVSDGVTDMSGLHTISVDGIDIATGVTAIPNKNQVQKICSGLSYGTHTVKILVTSTAYNYIISDFIIYQPKKPSIPAGALEVADYNLMANFVYNATTSSDGLSQGVLRKLTTREMIFVGTWNTPILNPGYMGGISTVSSTASSYVEYTFFGTGTVFRWGINTGAQSYTVSIDGSSNLSAFSTEMTAPAGLTFTASTGVITGSPAIATFANSLRVSDLPLGVHRIRVTWTSGQVLGPHGMEIITPIHINNSNFKVGSQSLKSVAKYSPEKTQTNAGPDLSKAKAWVLYNSIDKKILSSNNISAVLRTTTGEFIVYFQKQFKNSYYAAFGQTSQQGMVQIGSSEVTDVFKRADSCLVRTTIQSGGTTASSNPHNLSLSFFGELIDE